MRVEEGAEFHLIYFPSSTTHWCFQPRNNASLSYLYGFVVSFAQSKRFAVSSALDSYQNRPTGCHSVLPPLWVSIYFLLDSFWWTGFPRFCVKKGLKGIVGLLCQSGLVYWDVCLYFNEFLFCYVFDFFYILTLMIT